MMNACLMLNKREPYTFLVFMEYMGSYVHVWIRDTIQGSVKFEKNY